MLVRDIFNNVSNLLISRGWQKSSKHTKYYIFTPPAHLKFEPSYRLYIYNKAENADFEDEFYKTLKIISQIYNESIDELLSIIDVDRKSQPFNGTNNFYGKIIQLSSKDVEADKNTIIVESEIKKVKSKISVQLSSEDYQMAVDAHKFNKTVLIKGTIEKTKTQYRVTELQGFKALSR